MNIELYYFSGTGNSLYVAKELKKRIPGVTLIPIVSLLCNKTISTKAEIIGFIFPIYLMLVPVPVRRFLEKLDISVSTYCFTVITREGTMSLAQNYVSSCLKKKGKQLDAYFLLNMVQNSPTGIKPTRGDQNWVNTITPDRIAVLDSVVQEQLDLIQTTIVNRNTYPETKSSQPVRTFFARLLSWVTDKIESEVKFHVDDTCTMCGICEKVCLSGKIAIKNKRPVWQKDVRCFYCFACFNFCPEQAILVGDSYTLKNGRYVHPGIAIKDIAAQKK